MSARRRWFQMKRAVSRRPWVVPTVTVTVLVVAVVVIIALAMVSGDSDSAVGSTTTVRHGDEPGTTLDTTTPEGGPGSTAPTTAGPTTAAPTSAASGDSGTTPGDGSSAPTTRAPSDARTAVTVDDCTAKGGPKVTVTNATAGAQKYMVVLTVKDSSGQVVGSAGGSVAVVDPGKSAEATLRPTVKVPAGATCEVKQIIRTPVG